MNREEARQLLPIIQAFAEGKAVQCRPSVVAPWNDLDGAVNFLYGPGCYRIKPEPKFRPWNDSEIPKVMVLRRNNQRALLRVWRFSHDVEGHHIEAVEPLGAAREAISAGFALANFVHVLPDGTEHPCGVMEGEP